jgi:CheY-like chemotaxis protein
MSEQLAPSVLIVDDISLIRQLEVFALQTAGYRTRGARDGHEALDLLSRESFDAVLMNIDMPQMNGLEATRAIRQRESGTQSRLPIVFVTAHAEYERPEVHRAAGADGYLSKPFHFQDLVRVLEQLKLAPQRPRSGDVVSESDWPCT